MITSSKMLRVSTAAPGWWVAQKSNGNLVFDPVAAWAHMRMTVDWEAEPYDDVRPLIAGEVQLDPPADNYALFHSPEPPAGYEPLALEDIKSYLGIKAPAAADAPNT